MDDRPAVDGREPEADQVAAEPAPPPEAGDGAEASAPLESHDGTDASAPLESDDDVPPAEEMAADEDVPADDALADAAVQSDGTAADETPADDAATGADDLPFGPAEHDLSPDDRAAALRLAHLHLRMGSLALARAELEALAGRGALDEASLLDLAEARWRTGDTTGAGEAANAALERGVDDPLAYAIAAEAVAALGRPAEARRLTGLAMAGLAGSLDALFAGMPRSHAWPGESEPDGVALLAAAGHRVRAARDDDLSPASAGAAEAFAGGRAALASGDPATAALRLGVAIRLEPKYAQAVLAAIGDRAGEPFLALVAGDALRLLGREHEALDAYDRARGKPRETDTPQASGAAEPWPDDDDA